MLERSRRNRTAPSRYQDGSSTGSEVGCINLGDRCFLIRSISDHAEFPGFRKHVQFVLEDRLFGVFEQDGSSTPETADLVQDLVNRLSARELQIAIMVAQGHGTKAIAHRLQISEWTVATYLRRVFAKLNVENRAAMVYRCAPLINAALGLNGVTGRRQGSWEHGRPSE